MQLTRRGFLQATAGAMSSVGTAGFASATAQELTAAPSRVQLAPLDYPATEVWSYDGQVPGRELRLPQGSELDLRLINGLEEATTIHWHGQRLPNAMDGVPGMTQVPVAPGETFDYRFPLKDAGTFWYHPHANSQEQISRGLAGVLVVEEPEGPDVDVDRVLVFDDWRMTDTAQIHASFGNRHDMSHAGRLGNYVTVNGRSELVEPYAAGTRLRLRLVNVATARVFQLRLSGMQAWVMAYDGMPLDRPETTDRIELGPGQRADLFVDLIGEPDEEAVIGSIERGGTFAMVSFPVTGAGTAMRPAPGALPPNALPTVSLSDARSAALVLEGGAMRGLPETVMWQGQTLEARAAAEAGQFWVFNGVAGMTQEPLVEAALGETIRIPIKNRTAFPHAMHLHGMHFREVLEDGALGPWRDTLVVHRDETRAIAFVADNPGDWMFHCHMAAHQMSGMMSWIRVV